MPKILNFVKKIHYDSKLFTSLLRNDTAYVDPKTLQYPCEWGHDDGGCETDPVFRELCAYSCYPVLDITLNGNDYQYQPADVEDGGALVSSCVAENNKGMLAFAELFLEV